MTVLISALVAAVVTLGIEFFAKPSLEARKDRILEEQRSRRTALKAFGTVQFHLGQTGVMVRDASLASAVRSKRLSDVHELFRAAVVALREHLAAGGDELDHLEKAGLYSFGAASEAYLFFVDDLGLEHETCRAFYLEVLDPFSDRVQASLDLPRWRWRRARQLRAEIDALVREG